ncbi:MAG: NusG domain II-containing protein [bacterium]|nr:NusG domain II-containing protein [bacterium]
MDNIKKNLKWTGVFLLLIMICLFVSIIHSQLSETAKTAQIIQDGQVIQTIDLQNVKEPYEFEITAKNGGYNTVRVENDKIGIIHASCPDKICVKQGFITNGTLPIVCLPNKLSIVIVNNNDELDAVTGGIMQ